jgi:hypothetical protein
MTGEANQPKSILEQAEGVTYNKLKQVLAEGHGMPMTLEIAEGYACGALSWIQEFCGPEHAAEFIREIADASKDCATDAFTSGRGSPT